MKERTAAEILRDIQEGLSGNPEEDREYLTDMAELYRDHSEAREIQKGIGKMLVGILPGEGQRKLIGILEKRRREQLEKLEQIRFRMFRQDYDEALKEAEELVEQAEAGTYEEGVYYSFDEAFEELLYKVLNQPEKEIRRPVMPMSRIYAVYGILLVELGRTEEAQKVLEKGLRWNPYDMEIRAEYAETWKMQKNNEEYLNQVIESLKYIYRPQYLARAYRDIGYYFVEKKMYSEATFMYYLSMRWEPESKNAAAELYYIEQAAEEEIRELTASEIRALAETYEFPVGGNPQVLSIAYNAGKQLYEEKDPGAEYYLRIVYDMTQDEEVGEILEKITKPA